VLGDGAMYEHPGIINFLDRALDPTTGTFLLRARFPNPDHRLIPGMFARVRLNGELDRASILIPDRAVQELLGRHFVLVVGAEDKIERRPVVPAERQGNLWRIREGLAEGDRVVVEGLQKAREGVTVEMAEYVDPPAPEDKLKDGRFCLLRDIVECGGQDAAHQVFEAFYKTKGLPRIQKRVAYFAAKVGVTAGDIQIKDLGYRWASCTPRGDLHFHWKCLMAPLTIIDYIIVHELSHMYHRDHSEAFWNEVDKALPDYRERKEWLRTRGAGLDL